jgi:8-oxo-dGTP pyrophosphatase MutT (NUDIX family)
MDQSTPPVPRLAATILLVRDEPFEVLMVRRADKAVFSAALVFPGGTVDESDSDPAWLAFVDGAAALDAQERALRIAACRETFEETGLLLHSGKAPVGLPGDCATQPFRAVVEACGARLPLDRIVPFGHWVTPEAAPKRFDTHFYLCRAPEGQVARCDGGETVALEWVAPRDVLARAAAGESAILMPTRMNVKRLAESGTAGDALDAARARPAFTVLPVIEKGPDGTIVHIPEEAGYGETVFVTARPRQ